MKYTIAAALMTLAGAVSGQASADELDWLSGCWRDEARSYREVWSRPESGHLFGYALTLDGQTAVFFEQTRIDLGAVATFNAYPEGFGPSLFTEESRGKNAISFVNDTQDYPQRILYARDGRRLIVSLSRLDGAERQDFELRRC
jgi:hypothetical protein